MSTSTTSPVAASLAQVVERHDLDEARAYALAEAIMAGDATPAQIGGLLVGLRLKGETIDEITGFARALRDRARPVPTRAAPLVDTCGTGGDAKGTFNVSTVTALVAAGAGAKVAKHGNRSVSSKCGSSEVLAALGIPAELEPEAAARCLDTHGIAFLHAPVYHQATRHAVAPRREIGVRSIFNLVGPLTNPARATRQVMGVFRGDLTEALAHVLKRLGSEHCLVVHGRDGLDEISISAPTLISELKDGEVRTEEFHPEQVGLPLHALEDIRGGDPTENAGIAKTVLAGEPGARRDIVLLNAAAALYVTDVVPTIRDGVAAAAESIDSGAAQAKLDALRGETA